MWSTIVDWFSDVIVWYWIMALVIIGITLISSYVNDTWIPAIWGLIIGGILIAFPSYLEPALFGWLITTDIIVMTVSFIFMILWILFASQCIYNSFRYDGRLYA